MEIIQFPFTSGQVVVLSYNDQDESVPLKYTYSKEKASYHMMEHKPICLVPFYRELRGQVHIACCGFKPKATRARKNEWSKVHVYVGHIFYVLCSHFHG